MSKKIQFRTIMQFVYNRCVITNDFHFCNILDDAYDRNDRHDAHNVILFSEKERGWCSQSFQVEKDVLQLF